MKNMIPKDEKYTMPPEWVDHERTFISWPVHESMVYPDDYDAVCHGYIELVNAIASFEPVTIIVNPTEIDKVSSLFNDENVECLPIEHNDAWLRDNGPTFILNEEGELAGINWEFNAWGGKYAPWDLDDKVAPKVLKYYDIPCFDAPLVMEGGSFHVDGEGTLITTEECLLNPNRNPHLSREQIEDYLKKYLNVEKIIWLKKGLASDETDGHVDNIAAFAAPGKVILQVSEDPEDDNFHITKENLDILANATDARGRKLEVIQVQQPPMQFHKEIRLTLSYLNFYFVNNGIILPVFGGTARGTDELAEKLLKNTFPDREIRKIDGMAIIKEGGNVHCTTQQMPLSET